MLGTLMKSDLVLIRDIYKVNSQIGSENSNQELFLFINYTRTTNITRIEFILNCDFHANNQRLLN